MPETSSIQVLPGPLLIAGDTAVLLSPIKGFELASQLARASFHGVLEQEAAAVEAAEFNARRG